MDQAFTYLENTGVMNSSDYAYTARGGNCKFDKSKVAAKVTGYKFASGDQAGAVDEDALKQMLYENGPFAIAINATPLQMYFGGIMDPFSFLCNPKSLNHGVLLVGYGVENNKKYWIIKNSWGSSWGEKGFFRIIRGKISNSILRNTASEIFQNRQFKIVGFDTIRKLHMYFLV